MNQELQEIITELEELAQKATPGPWHASARTTARNCPQSLVVSENGLVAEVKSLRGSLHLYGSRNDVRAWDAAWIAAANPAFILTLLAEIERLDKLVELWRHDYETLVDNCAMRKRQAQ